MIEAIIRWSVANRVMVMMLAVVLAGVGTHAVLRTPVDAIPDLSDVQVIVKTTWSGQAPQVIEDQVTWPLTTAMLGVPGAVTVRGYSFFNDSFVYILFEDGTDLYWARSRVLEQLSRVVPTLPKGARAALGPDATGVGWVYQYALVDRGGGHDLAELTSLQDWFLRFELQTVEGVAEIATIGGMVRQYQVVVDPDRLRSFGIPLTRLRDAIRRGNRESGGRVIEMAEAEYMIRASGYIDDLDDLRAIPLALADNGTPVLLGDVAEIRFGPELRRGIGELDGEGEAVGGVVILRFGGDARATIERVKARLEVLKASLPPGVEIVETYDRSALIDRSIATLVEALAEEFLLVALICVVFLFHLRSSLVVILSLPLAVLAAFVIMRMQGINANIMSLGGIAIAVGAMVDAAIVMVENFHKQLERSEPGTPRWRMVADSTSEVGPPLFFSLLIIAFSFLPIFALEAQEGRMFHPLAWTKTWAMTAASVLAITLVPVLVGLLVRGRITPEARNPVNRGLIAVYRPVLGLVLRHPAWTLGLTLLAIASAAIPLGRLGSEFMPELDEGDLLYMPSAFPAISAGKMAQVLQQTDRLIMTVPEVQSVYAKAGRASSATDPAPLTMVETTIRLKPRSEWRPGMTTDKLRRELDALVRIPGLTNVWTMPIRNRIDMLSTGIKTPVGIRVSGPELATIARLGREIEEAVRAIPGTASVFAERVTGGRYVDIDVNRLAAARFGLGIDDVHDIVNSAIGGMSVGESIEGRERYPINLRYPQDLRDSPEALRALPIVTAEGAEIPLSALADIRIGDGPGVIRSENSRLSGVVFVDIAGRDLGSYVSEAQEVVAREVELPPGYTIAWSGQYEYLERARERLALVAPATIAIILMLLWLSFRKLVPVLIVAGTLPLAAVGGLWLLWLLGYRLSVAVGAGFIALAGITIEIGVLMIVFLEQALARRRDLAAQAGRDLDSEDFEAAAREGALLRIRSILMTVAVDIVGLMPIMLATGAGSEVMRRIAAPLVGGMASAILLALLVLPAVWLLWRRRSPGVQPAAEA